MKWLLLLIVIAVVSFTLGIAIKKQKTKQSGNLDQPWPYYEKKPLTAVEQVLYHRLVEAMPECIVLAQVQMSRVLGVKKGTGQGSWFNKINQKSLDYVICLKDASIVAAVELDDSTHEREDRKSNDQDKDRALSSAGVKLIRWQAKNLPDIQVIREAFTR